MGNTVRTDEKIFQVILDWENPKLVNLDGLEHAVVNSKGVRRIEHLWNGQFRKISKKDLKASLESHGLNSDFLKLV